MQGVMLAIQVLLERCSSPPLPLRLKFAYTPKNTIEQNLLHRFYLTSSMIAPQNYSLNNTLDYGSVMLIPTAPRNHVLCRASL